MGKNSRRVGLGAERNIIHYRLASKNVQNLSKLPLEMKECVLRRCGKSSVLSLYKQTITKLIFHLDLPLLVTQLYILLDACLFNFNPF